MKKGGSRREKFEELRKAWSLNHLAPFDLVKVRPWAGKRRHLRKWWGCARMVDVGG